MRYLFLLVSIFFGFSAVAQSPQKLIDPNLPFYTCQDSVKLNKEKTTVELFGKVSFKTNSLEIKNADKIVFNNLTKVILVTGKFDYVMSGVINVIPGGEKKTLKYRLGETTAYIY